MHEEPQPLTLTVDHAAQLLGISRGLAYEPVRRGELPAIRLGRRLVVPANAIDEMLRALTTRTAWTPPSASATVPARDRSLPSVAGRRGRGPTPSPAPFESAHGV